jgi:glycosyltransferase involved in cell wall biosynthesis
VRIVIDYRPALRARTGVGEYIHHLIKALAQNGADDLTLFTSSWKDRPSPELAVELPNVHIVDQHIPVRALNIAWHRLGWPPVETIAAHEYDVAHSPHPLLLPTRSAAQVVTIHDLHFMNHPERTSKEIRRDYPALAGRHARRADRIIVSSKFAADEVQRTFQVDRDKIAVCPAGAPEWKTAPAPAHSNGYVLFMGTLDERKNVGGLLHAYGQFISSRGRENIPRLLIAGSPGPRSGKWLQEIGKPPLADHVEYVGYIGADQRERIFKGAQLFVLPSFEEGFGLPALEAMSAGVPVVASDRGSLPEVVGDAGLLINPDDPSSLAAAIERMVSDAGLRKLLAQRGLERARLFSWKQTAQAVRRAYEDALLARTARTATLSHAHRH